MRVALLIASWGARLLLAAFFVFVGYWKAVGPYAALAEHRAWVAGMPECAARGVGWSEIICATALLVPSFARTRSVAFWAAVILLINQCIALAVHVARGEAAQAAPQNLILCTLLLFAAFTTRPQGRMS